MKSTLLSMIIGLLICSTASYSQSYSFLPEKSHKLSIEERKGKRIDSTIPVYTEEGVKLDQMEAMKYISGVNYETELYADEEGNVVALILREATPEERENKLNRLMARDNTGEWKDKPAPNFEGVDMQGKTVKLEELKGEVVALNFWFIGCKPCLVEIPELNELVKKYEDKGVHFIAIGLDARDKLPPFLEKTAFDYDIIPEGMEISKLYNISGYPSHFLIDQEGKVSFFNTGYNGALVKILDKRIENLLSEGNK